jgi:glutathione peroxidase
MKLVVAIVLLRLAIAPPIATAKDASGMSFFDLSAKTLDGGPLPLATFAGRVVLVVNTASQCGFTPQYAGLQQLHTELSDRGFTVLGVPSNEFGGQEPGSPEQINAFASENYAVTFPLLEKAKTTGTGQSPLYAFLTKGRPGPRWNFHKYLVGRNGEVLADFPSSVAPGSPEMRRAIEDALRAK